MTTNPKTGLPEIPEGCFWRVKKYGTAGRVIEFRNRRRFGSEVIDYEILLPRDLNPEGIENRAQVVWGRVREALEQPDYCGDYPPKRLGD